MKKEKFKYSPGWFICDKCGKHIYFTEKRIVVKEYGVMRVSCPGCHKKYVFRETV